MKATKETLKIMNGYFGKDNLLSLATTDGDFPSVRCVDAYFEDGFFYTIVYATTKKMKQIKANPNVAFCSADWLTGHGKAKDLGYIHSEENLHLAEKLKSAFAAWYDNGHINDEDKNTIILAIEVTDCKFFHEGKPCNVKFGG